MADCKPVGTPIEPGLKLRKDNGDKEVDNTYFKQIVGSLMYLTSTRPDIMYAVSLISRYMEKPSEMHLNAVRRILRYVTDTIDCGMFYKRKNSTDLVGYTDSDYAGDVDDRESTSGHAFMLNSGAILWSSKKQDIVTLSTTEAEFVTAASSSCQALWLRRMF
uniref:Secreted RxLR effector protein 161-like n=1 Tax=Nelumbo nucifera TaxID=4432 RepID=A0A822Y7P1_NELNU|nr:TPA_asm: hypothetical protein HUJ06_029925 [Nelumbo nucifera]